MDRVVSRNKHLVSTVALAHCKMQPGGVSRGVSHHDDDHPPAKITVVGYGRRTRTRTSTPQRTLELRSALVGCWVAAHHRAYLLSIRFRRPPVDSSMDFLPKIKIPPICPSPGLSGGGRHFGGAGPGHHIGAVWGSGAVLRTGFAEVERRFRTDLFREGLQAVPLWGDANGVGFFRTDLFRGGLQAVPLWGDANGVGFCSVGDGAGTGYHGVQRRWFETCFGRRWFSCFSTVLVVRGYA